MYTQENRIENEEGLSHPEKRNIAYIICNILVLLLYSIYVFRKYQQGEINLAEDLSFWGLTILIFVAISVVVRIVIEILLNIINAIVTRKEEDLSFTDERDKLIEFKAIKISEVVVGIGFLLSMISLVVKMPPFVMINVIFFSLFIGDIIGSVAQLFYYRRGF